MADLKLLKQRFFFLNSNMSAEDSIQDQIHRIIHAHRIVLFMKGSPQAPMCGFSAKAVQLLIASGFEPAAFYFIDVLKNPEIRAEIKNYSDWSTIPQLYIGGEFIGGSDIMMELYQSGELKELLTSATSSTSTAKNKL